MNNITVLIQRDARNMPYAKVLYNNQDAFNMDEESAGFATYVTRKAAGSGLTDGIVYASPLDGTIIDINSINRRMYLYYCISGSEVGTEAIQTLITTLRVGANNLDINAALFVTDGKSAPIWVNEDVQGETYKLLGFDSVCRIELYKQDQIDEMIKEPVGKGIAKTLVL